MDIDGRILRESECEINLSLWFRERLTGSTKTGNDCLGSPSYATNLGPSSMSSSIMYLSSNFSSLTYALVAWPMEWSVGNYQ